MQLVAILSALTQQGFVVVDDFLPLAITRQLQQVLTQHLTENSLKPANIGRLNGFEIPKTDVSHIRGDSTVWLEETNQNPVVQAYFNAMQTLKTAFNSQLYLGVDALEAHFAHYPIGGFYQKHLDQFQTTNAKQATRKISSVLYLNQDWVHEFGGELRLYLDNGNTLDFLPIENRLVLFCSDQFWHEVRPATRARMSIAGWFKTRTSI